MDLPILTNPGPKPPIDIYVTTVTASDVETKTINHLPIFSPSNLNVSFSDYKTTYSPIPGNPTPITGSSTTTTKINIPSAFWAMTDSRATYYGPSGNIYYYNIKALFNSSNATDYKYFPFFNGVADSNITITYSNNDFGFPFDTTGQVSGTRVFNNGDYVQFGFEAFSIVPTDTIESLNFILFRVG